MLRLVALLVMMTTPFMACTSDRDGEVSQEQESDRPGSVSDAGGHPGDCGPGDPLPDASGGFPDSGGEWADAGPGPWTDGGPDPLPDAGGW